MRLTNTTLLRGYNRNLNRLKTAKNDCEQKITSTRKFSRASEAPLLAAKALNVRKSQYYNEQYTENLKVASSFYTEAETSLLQVSSKMAEIRETIIAACNTTKDSVDYKIYAQQLETNARELCSVLNTDSAGRSIFGGEGDDAMPFQIIDDSNGNASTVTYYGVPVNSLRDCNAFPWSNKVYVDVGLGMQTNQESHYTDPMSVLDISFNGAEITGCGAESSVADVDLSQIRSGRQYVIDVYCDGIKKTIEFKGKGTKQENVDMINDLLNEAYRKDITYKRNHPVMDESGVVYSIDADGNAVEGGLVSITNNTVHEKSKRAEALVIDNDSGYTSKFRFNLSALKEGTKYSVNVTVGNETKMISFEAGTDNMSDSDNPIYREDVSVRNIQAALDEAFGEGVVTISDHDPTMGIVSCEGQNVKLSTGEPIGSDVSGMPTITSSAVKIETTTPTSKLNFGMMKVSRLEDTSKKFTFAIGGNSYEVEIKPGDDEQAIMDAVNAKLSANNLKVNDKGVVTNAGGAIQTITAAGDSSKIVGSITNYKIDPSNLTLGEKYKIKVVVGNQVKDIQFTAGNGDYGDLADRVKDAFGTDVTVEPDGTFKSASFKSISIADNSGASTDKVTLYERERVYSNNYIQLTLDAARALRNNDIEYATGCIDRIVTANENLLVEIADLGCNEDFIDFNLEKITTRQYNLAERQNDLETIDPEYMITLMKQYEAYYNAALQMSASAIPNSIWNYMK